MAEIPVERKEGGSLWWLWLLLAVLIVGLLIWWATDTDEEEIAPVGEPSEIVGVETPGADPVTPPEPVALEGGVSVGDILGNPAEFIGRDDIQLQGVTVPGVPTDRGFWIEDQGKRIFAVVVDAPREVPKDINPNQRLVLREAMARDATFIQNIPGAPLDQDTLGILRDQDVYLVVSEEDIEIVNAAGAGAATD